MLMRTRQIRPVEICSNIYDFGDLQEGQFVAQVGANDIRDIVVWYASAKGGDGVLVVLVCHILTRITPYLCICTLDMRTHALVNT